MEDLGDEKLRVHGDLTIRGVTKPIVLEGEFTGAVDFMGIHRAGFTAADLAHAGPKTFDDALAQTRLPPIVSHAGARAVHDTWRNLSDDQIRAIAQRGGVIGVMLVPPALEHPDLFEAFEHLAHIVEVGGEDLAALG